MFKIRTDADDIPIGLDYQYGITSDWLNKQAMGVLNSITVIEKNKFYVTQYMEKPLNIDGTFNMEDTSVLKMLFAKPSTHVFYCDFTTGELECKMVATGILVANGITRSVDKSTIFVADSYDRSIIVYKRNKETNELTEEQKVLIPHSIDNVKLDPVTGKVYGGVFTNQAAMMSLNYMGENPDFKGGTFELDYNIETG